MLLPGVCKYLSWVAGNINNVPNVYGLHTPQVAEKQGVPRQTGGGVPREAGTKYNIKYSDDAQDAKRGVAIDAKTSEGDCARSTCSQSHHML